MSENRNEPQDTTEAALDDIEAALQAAFRSGVGHGEALAALSTIRSELERLREENAKLALELKEAYGWQVVVERNAALSQLAKYEAALEEAYAVIRDRLKSASMSVERSDNDHAAFDHAAGIIRRALAQEEKS